MLGSIEATFRRDSQLAGPQLRFWAPSAGAEEQRQRCSSLGLQPLEESFFEDRSLEARQLPPWPLLRHLQQQGVPCCAILSFSTEGDNAADAVVMATAAAQAAGLQAVGDEQAAAAQRQWVPPSSWQYVYGTTGAVY